MPYIVGAYAASPTAAIWDPVAESAYLEQVAALPTFGGLELPYAGSLHHDESWLMANLNPSWDLVLTTIAGTVARNAADPDFGLASTRPASRRAAVEFNTGVASAVQQLNDWAGRRMVVAVELHSAPTGRGDPTALTTSLEEISRSDWDGAAITLEHCDAVTNDHSAQKGYLSLADEIEVIRQAPDAFGITLNWARSAIEGRSTGAAVEHIVAAREAGVLTGLMFSGAASRQGAFGDAWLDAHLPPTSAGFAQFADLLSTEPSSLLGPTEIADALEAADGSQRFTGIKIGVRPLDLPIASRVGFIADALQMVERVAAMRSGAI